MVKQVVSKGLRLNFTGKVPSVYKEKNDRSIELNKQFGIKEVKKLLSNGVIEEVDKDKVVCVNPMSYGKKRLCIDIS